MLENYEIEIKAKREQEDKELAEARAKEDALIDAQRDAYDDALSAARKQEDEALANMARVYKEAKASLDAVEAEFVDFKTNGVLAPQEKKPVRKGRGLRIIAWIFGGFGMFLVTLVAILYIVFMLTANKANVKPIIDENENGIVIEDVREVKEKARKIFKPKSKVVRKPKRRVIKKVTPKKAKAAPSTDWRDTVFQSGN